MDFAETVRGVRTSEYTDEDALMAMMMKSQRVSRPSTKGYASTCPSKAISKARRYCARNRSGSTASTLSMSRG